jgi:hypothetical protein
MSANRHSQSQYGGSAPATPGFNAVAPEWLFCFGAAHAAPAVPAAESTLGSHPCVALSSAQVLPEWITSTSPVNAFAANGVNPLNFVSHPKGSLQTISAYPLDGVKGRVRFRRVNRPRLCADKLIERRSGAGIRETCNQQLPATGLAFAFPTNKIAPSKEYFATSGEARGLTRHSPFSVYVSSPCQSGGQESGHTRPEPCPPGAIPDRAQIYFEKIALR